MDTFSSPMSAVRLEKPAASPEQKTKAPQGATFTDVLLLSSTRTTISVSVSLTPTAMEVRLPSVAHTLAPPPPFITVARRNAHAVSISPTILSVHSQAEGAMGSMGPNSKERNNALLSAYPAATLDFQYPEVKVRFYEALTNSHFFRGVSKTTEQQIIAFREDEATMYQKRVAASQQFLVDRERKRKAMAERQNHALHDYALQQHFSKARQSSEERRQKLHATESTFLEHQDESRSKMMADSIDVQRQRFEDLMMRSPAKSKEELGNLHAAVDKSLEEERERYRSWSHTALNHTLMSSQMASELKRHSEYEKTAIIKAESAHERSAVIEELRAVLDLKHQKQRLEEQEKHRSASGVSGISSHQQAAAAPPSTSSPQREAVLHSIRSELRAEEDRRRRVQMDQERQMAEAKAVIEACARARSETSTIGSKVAELQEEQRRNVEKARANEAARRAAEAERVQKERELAAAAAAAAVARTPPPAPASASPAAAAAAVASPPAASVLPVTPPPSAASASGLDMVDKTRESDDQSPAPRQPTVTPSTMLTASPGALSPTIPVAKTPPPAPVAKKLPPPPITTSFNSITGTPVATTPVNANSPTLPSAAAERPENAGVTPMTISALTSPTPQSGPGTMHGDWKEMKQESTGKTYYFNVKTKKTTWNEADVKGDSTPATVTAQSLATGVPGTMHGDWKEMKQESTGKAYFFNVKTKKTTWHETEVRESLGSSSQSTEASTPAAASGPGTMHGDWKEMKQESTGKTYYFNIKTKKTTWNEAEVKGSGSSTATPVPAAASGPKIPSGIPGTMHGDWKEMKQESTGKAYYFNVKTKKTTWHEAEVRESLSSTASASSTPAATQSGPGTMHGDWKEMKQESTGKTYYFNVKTRKTTWNEADVKSQSSGGESALAEGWEEKKAPSGKPFYYHAKTKKTTWKREEAC